MTGQPGICFVTRGPGATNASAGIPHRAPGSFADDHVLSVRVDREMPIAQAFQELDYRAVFGTNGEVGNGDRRSVAHPGDRLARLSHRRNGRPGPVVIALPEDMLRDARGGGRCRRLRARGNIARRRMTSIDCRSCLAQAKRPVALHWRQPLDRAGECRADAVCRAALRCRSRQPSGAVILLRRDASLLCRRLRYRAKSKAARSREGRRPGAADRRSVR